MTKDEALKLALKPCPFCGGEGEYQKDSVRSGYGEYESHETYHTIKCKKCGSLSKRIHQKHLIDFTKYTVRDFRENPILRAKVEDDYDAYCEQSKQLAIDAWNIRTAIEQAEKQEPVGEVDSTGMAVIWANKPMNGAKLYTTSPNVATPLAAQLKWVGLTPSEVDRCWNMTPMDTRNSRHMFAYAIEAKLKAKNSP